MCGIVGVVSSSTSGLFTTHQKIFEQLLWADTLRGEDSTGVFGVNRYGNVDYLKVAGNTDTLFKSKEWTDFYDDIYSQFHMVVGHNRKATKGATTDENAHPFVEGNTILVHNGTLFNHSSLTEKKVEVDSHAILHSIVERGYEKTIEELDGAFTLVWYDTEKKTLYVIRNEQRPLFIANTSGAWFFASEEKMLKWILSREEIKIEGITNCKPGTLYSFDLENKENMWYTPLKLRKQAQATYTPPTTVITPPATTTGGSTEKKDDTADETKRLVYANTDFPIGTKIVVCGTEVKKLKKANGKNTHIILGHWFFDMSVSVRCLCSEEDINRMDNNFVDDETDPIFQCHISTVLTNAAQGKVIIGAERPDTITSVFDMEGREIFEDQFIFSDKSCSYCGKSMTFQELQKGIFKFESSEDNEIMCEHCYDKGLYLP